MVNNFQEDANAVENARKALKEEWFNKWLEHAYSQCHPYRFPDIIGCPDSERNGGYKGIITFMQKLRTCPFDSLNADDVNTSYIGFAEPNVYSQF